VWRKRATGLISKLLVGNAIKSTESTCQFTANYEERNPHEPSTVHRSLPWAGSLISGSPAADACRPPVAAA